MSPPDVISVIDGRGRLARCAVTSVESGSVRAEILDIETRPRPKPHLAIYQGAAKGNKLDDVIERLAELGVAEVSVFLSSRSVVQWDAAKSERLSQRWRAIARGAAKQSRNPWVLEVLGPLSWTEAIRKLHREPVALALWEGATLPLRTAFVPEAERLALIVGPEGGLAREEAEAMADAGAQLVSLGPLILRTENAPVVAAAATLFGSGLIG